MLLKEKKTRNSETQKNREHLLTKVLNTFFNIAQANAMNSVKIAEDRELLIDQISERNMIMTSIDKKLENIKENSLKQIQRAKELEKRLLKIILHFR